MAILHVFSDATIYIMHFGKYTATVKKGEEYLFQLPRGRHKVSFISEKYGVAVSEEHIVEIPENDYEDFLEIHLLREENCLEKNLKSVTNEDSWVIDSEGNYYSSNWERLLKGASREVIHIDPRCKYICGFAFRNNNVIRTVYLPDTIIAIGDCAFDSCELLTCINNTERVSYIGTGSFSGCKALSAINIDALLHVSDDAFINCEKLQRVRINSNLISIGRLAFFSCKSLRNISIPDATQIIHSKAFASSGIESITIPKGIDRIEKECFNFCRQLKSIQFSDSIVEIDNGAFEFCEELEELYLPDSIRSIGEDAFGCCKKLKRYQSLTVFCS